MPFPQDALPGREQKMVVSNVHAVNGNPTVPPFPKNMEIGMFGMGCFWGAERLFWQEQGVFSTQVGYSAGYTPNPTYEEVCTGNTDHTEVVRVVFDPTKVSFEKLLQVFMENHKPNQLNHQGESHSTQCRSAVYYYSDQQKLAATVTRDKYQKILKKEGLGEIKTDIAPAKELYYAEDYHQQYLYKNPEGYCGVGGTGVSCPIGVVKKGVA